MSLSQFHSRHSIPVAVIIGRHDAAHGRDSTIYAMPHSSLTLASRLDLEAGAELAMGHHAAAERLAHKAAELRGWA